MTPQRLIVSAFSLTFLFAGFGAADARTQATPSHAPDGFMNGVDVSALKTLEDDGAVYRNGSGTPRDPIEMLMHRGIDWYRLRLFVAPSGEGVVNNDLAYTTALAKRIKEAGGKFLLDFHYSDTWADPGHQTKPASWEGLSFDELTRKVQSYTRGVIEYLRETGAMPEMVQIGNEISTGMIWPDGRLWVEDDQAEFDRLAALVEAGIRGVRQGAGDQPTPAIMLHLAFGQSWDKSHYFFDQFNTRGVEFDVIGYSFYPRFGGTIDAVEDNVRRSIQAFGKPVVLVELGFAYAGGEKEPRAEHFEYPCTPQGQAAFTREVVQMIQGMPNGMGRGVFWWHAAATPTPSNLAWSNGRLGLFDQTGRILPAVDALAGKTPQDAGRND